ncbi:LysR family transcriptional regulator, partial [Xanthomonas vasicola]
IVMQPDFLAEPHLAAGRLVRILPEYTLAEIGIFAVYTSRSHLAPKVRSFIDYLIECMAKPAPG